MKTLKLQRPQPLEISLEDGRVFIVQPATRQRMREALELDSEEDDERPLDQQARVALQLAALVGPEIDVVEAFGSATTSRRVASAEILATLTPAEELQLLWAVWGQATGYTPAASLAVLKKKVLTAAMLVAAASSASTGTPPV